MADTGETTPLVIHLGKEELVVRRRYEAASIANDVLIALWFIAGSIMFFFERWTTTGTWCFLIGSIELLIRPAIRLARHVHLLKVRSRGPRSHPAAPAESSQDY
ncbi:YrhK family protein [Streptomyces sp. NPDC091272]|uniref:YrhK family protein n=1 Tax=Streptomyces sp. NPDC091272 TaxID=3365981 RepID=UPI0037FFCAA8